MQSIGKNKLPIIVGRKYLIDADVEYEIQVINAHEYKYTKGSLLLGRNQSFRFLDGRNFSVFHVTMNDFKTYYDLLRKK